MQSCVKIELYTAHWHRVFHLHLHRWLWSFINNCSVSQDNHIKIKMLLLLCVTVRVSLLFLTHLRGALCCCASISHKCGWGSVQSQLSLTTVKVSAAGMSFVRVVSLSVLSCVSSGCRQRCRGDLLPCCIVLCCWRRRLQSQGHLSDKQSRCLTLTNSLTWRDETRWGRHPPVNPPLPHQLRA